MQPFSLSSPLFAVPDSDSHSAALSDRQQELKWCGLMIRRRRRQMEWSQESLSHGICSNSYLSKIESGQAVPSLEILRLLAARLSMDLPLPSDADRQKESELLRLLESGQTRKAQALFQNAWQNGFSEAWKESVWGLLLSALLEQKPMDSVSASSISLIEEDLLQCMNSCQSCLWLLIQNKYQQAAKQADKAWILAAAINGMYKERKSDIQILQLAEKAYMQAAMEGHPYLMADLSHFEGVLCSNLPDLDSAFYYFQRADHLISALQDTQRMDELQYNQACVSMENGDFETASGLLEGIQNPNAMDLQKLAICYELKGLKNKARMVLEKITDADYGDWDASLMNQMIALQKIRLTNTDYLRDPKYGKALMQIFDTLCGSSLHKGFAQFYLPWVIQWLKSQRQYARLASILESFPGKPLFQVL